MAEITKTGRPSLASTNVSPSCRLTGLVAGEPLDAGDACYIKASDGRVYKASGATANAEATRVRGFAAVTVGIAMGITLLRNVNIGYGSTLTPGVDYFLSGTVPGGLADAASTGGTKPIAFAFDKTRIHVCP